MHLRLSDGRGIWHLSILWRVIHVLRRPHPRTSEVVTDHSKNTHFTRCTLQRVTRRVFGARCVLVYRRSGGQVRILLGLLARVSATSGQTVNDVL